MLLVEAIETFLTFKQAENLSAKTIVWYQHHLGVFAQWFPPERRLQDIRSVDVARYIADQANPKRIPRLADYTVRARYSTIRAFFNWAESSDEAGRPTSPIGQGAHKKVKPPRTGKPATRYVPFEHYQLYIKSITERTWKAARDRLLGIILFWTGVRLQECIDLTVGDVDTKRELLLVREGKGRKARYVPFDNDIIRPALLEYLYLRPAWDGPELWLGESADSHHIVKPLRPEGVRQILIRRCQRAHIPYYNPHAWRHAFGEWLINCGVSLAAVSVIMGHSSVQVTEQVYAHIRTPAIQREYSAAVAYMKGLELSGHKPHW